MNMPVGRISQTINNNDDNRESFDNLILSARSASNSKIVVCCANCKCKVYVRPHCCERGLLFCGRGERTFNHAYYCLNHTF